MKSVIADKVEENYGSWGLSFEWKVLYYDAKSGTVCFKVDRSFVQELQFALTCISSFNAGVPAVVRCLAVSGSLRVCMMRLWEVIERHVTYISGDIGGRKRDIRALKMQYLSELKGLDP